MKHISDTDGGVGVNDLCMLKTQFCNVRNQFIKVRIHISQRNNLPSILGCFIHTYIHTQHLVLACMHACLHACTNSSYFAGSFLFIIQCMYVRMYVCMYVCVYVCSRMLWATNFHLSYAAECYGQQTFTCLMHACMHACMYVCMQNVTGLIIYTDDLHTWIGSINGLTKH